MTELLERIAAHTEALVAIPSESGNEAAMLDAVRAQLPGILTVVDDEDAALLALPARRPGAPLILLAGHVDTVPLGGNAPARREGGTVHGRGAADMKGGIAVLLEVAAALADGRLRSELDVGLLCFGREELPFAESALTPLFARRPEIRDTALAIVLEPTDNALELGCLGNLNATVRFEGEAAHTARPWLGRNAIHAAVAALGPVNGSPIRDVDVGGLTYREVASVTWIEGGIATNVVPAHAAARVNLRYAPARSPEDAERYLRELLAHPSATVTIDGNAPPGTVPVRNPLVDRLRAAGDLAVGPKQAWTPVAEFGLIGVDAVNFGPGDPQYAHRDDERVEVDALVRSYDVLCAFLEGAPGREGRGEA
ncbi:MAG TPA: succinyl-diaminopimelate desuccinylase [Actinomycetota bacterium]